MYNWILVYCMTPLVVMINSWFKETIFLPFILWQMSPLFLPLENHLIPLHRIAFEDALGALMQTVLLRWVWVGTFLDGTFARLSKFGLFVYHSSVSTEIGSIMNRSAFEFLASESFVSCVDFNPNKPYQVAVGGDDCTIRIWDTRQLSKPLLNIRRHTHR